MEGRGVGSWTNWGGVAVGPAALVGRPVASVVGPGVGRMPNALSAVVLPMQARQRKRTPPIAAPTARKILRRVDMPRKPHKVIARKRPRDESSIEKALAGKCPRVPDVRI